MTKNIKHSTEDTKSKQSIPWLWLVMGILATLIVLGIALSALAGYLIQPAGDAPPANQPVVIVLTAPSVPMPIVPTVQPTPTIIATTTPVPTIDVSVAPATLTVGYYATVVNTGGVGVTVRNGASTRNQPVTIAAEGSYLVILDGPVEADSFSWWQVRLLDGTEGWVAGEFLLPAAAP